MAKPGIELNSAGMRDLLRSDGVRSELERRARKIAVAAGPGNVASSVKGRGRALARVYTNTWEARRAEAKERKLTRSIDAGRG